MASKPNQLIELVVVVIAMLIPQFLLASEVDGDEFVKGTSGIALAATILGAYKVWKGKSEVKNELGKDGS